MGIKTHTERKILIKINKSSQTKKADLSIDDPLYKKLVAPRMCNHYNFNLKWMKNKKQNLVNNLRKNNTQVLGKLQKIVNHKF